MNGSETMNGFDHPRDCACAECADLRLILSLEEPEAPLPSADFLWWKAQLQARREAVQKSTRPIALAERWGLAGAVAAVAVGASLLPAEWMMAVLAAVVIPAAPVLWWACRAHQSE